MAPEMIRLRGAFETAAREALAFARQAVLIPYDCFAPVLPRGARDGDDVVVFLHGLFASAGVLRPLRAAVARPDLHAAALTYPTGPGVTELAARLGGVLSALPAGARLHLVGHSMGGVVTRYYAETSGDARVVQTISLASPFGGIGGLSAAGVGLPAVRDLTPGSAVLRALREGRRARVPHLAVIAGADALVPCPREQILPGADVVVMEGRGHNTVLFDPEVARIVADRVWSRCAPAREAREPMRPSVAPPPLALGV